MATEGRVVLPYITTIMHNVFIKVISFSFNIINL